MEVKNYVNKICDIINSTEFKDKMIIVNSNYSNLKQENFIRNLILEELNTFFLKNSYDIRAFAEHPRINGSRVDLSIIDVRNKKNPFKIEFKFQYSKDSNHMKDYHRVIKKDFEDRQSDLFILTIANWNIDSKKVFDKKWNISTNLSRYISKNDDWKQNILKSFNEFKDTKLIDFEKIEIDTHYKTEYYFYILEKK